MNRLLQILPRVPPAVCGVGDYAWNLALALEQHEGISSRFLSAGTTWTDPGPAATRFPVHRLARLSAKALLDWVRGHAAEFDAILLHLSPYGFQKRAVPFWLAAAVRRLAQTRGLPPLITYFHELFASGPPTSSTFWLQPLQKRVLRHIARGSSARLTNRQAYADWLDEHPGARATEVIPVFSNLGELANPPALADRPPAMLLFASSNHSGEPVEALIQRAGHWARAFGLDRLHVIGRLANPPPRMERVTLECHGYLAAEQASALLAGSRLGFTAYNPAYLAKSGFFASQAAHGMVVIAQGRATNLPDGLIHGVHLLNESQLDPSALPDAQALQKLASSLHAWYRFHDLRATAARTAAAARLQHSPA